MTGAQIAPCTKDRGPRAREEYPYISTRFRGAYVSLSSFSSVSVSVSVSLSFSEFISLLSLSRTLLFLSLYFLDFAFYFSFRSLFALFCLSLSISLSFFLYSSLFLSFASFASFVSFFLSFSLFLALSLSFSSFVLSLSRHLMARARARNFLGWTSFPGCFRRWGKRVASPTGIDGGGVRRQGGRDRLAGIGGVLTWLHFGRFYHVPRGPPPASANTPCATPSIFVLYFWHAGLVCVPCHPHACMHACP